MFQKSFEFCAGNYTRNPYQFAALLCKDIHRKLFSVVLCAAAEKCLMGEK